MTSSICGLIGPREPDGHQHVCQFHEGHSGLHSYEAHALDVLRGAKVTDECCGVKRPPPNPRTRLCWACSRLLQANFHRVVLGVDGRVHVVHAACVDATMTVIEGRTSPRRRVSR